MAKKLDPQLLEILTTYGERPEDALWDCHGTWVAYHKAIERIAAKAGVVFDMPQIIEANTAAKTATIAVRGTMGERAEWSFGEASPANNKNAYPFAMAEKRAKDRVVIKLVGLSGIYSEEEADDFKPNASTTPNTVTGPALIAANQPVKSSAALKREGAWEQVMAELQNDFVDCHSLASLHKLRVIYRQKAIENGWNKAFLDTLKNEFDQQEDALKKAETLLAGE